jgi:hypothetical protein
MKRRIKILGKYLTLSQIITGVLTLVAAGLLNEIGKDIYSWIKTDSSEDANKAVELLNRVLFQKIETNILTLVVILLAFVPLYHILYKYFVSKLIKNEEVFVDDFSSRLPWNLNYWGNDNTKNTVVIENGHLILSAVPGQWQLSGENGAYYDL